MSKENENKINLDEEVVNLVKYLKLDRKVADNNLTVAHSNKRIYIEKELTELVGKYRIDY